MSATRKTLLIAALFGTFVVSVQTAAQARDLGMGARSFSHGMRGFAVNPGFARAKHFDGRLLSADALRSDATTKPSSALMVKVETTTMSAKKRVHGYVLLQVKGGSAAGARRGGTLATPKRSPQNAALLVPAVQSARPVYTPPPPTCATPGNCWPHHQPQN